MEFIDLPHPEKIKHMQQHIQHLAINNPCHENWVEMTPTDKGRHCANCQKEVIDFSGMSTEQVLAIIAVSGSICGRIGKTQLHDLNRQLAMNKRKFGWARTTFVIFLFTGLITVAKAKAVPKVIRTEQMPVKANADTIVHDVTEKFVRITGRVTDKQKRPLQGVSVQCDKYRANTDSSGVFQMSVPASASSLLIHYIGFQTRNVKLNIGKRKIYKITLEESEMVLGKIAFIKKPDTLKSLTGY